MPLKRLVLVTCLLAANAAQAQKFYPDDPIAEDRDNLPIDAPGELELSPTYDLLENSFAPPELEDPVPRAMNVNTLGEVPDSSWFVNRIGVRDISIEELLPVPARAFVPTRAAL